MGYSLCARSACCDHLKARAEEKGFQLRWSQRCRLCRPLVAGLLTAALAAVNPAGCRAAFAAVGDETAGCAQGWGKAEAAQTLCEASTRLRAKRLAEADRPPSPPDRERLDCFRCGLCRVYKLDALCDSPSPHRHAKTCNLDCCRVLCCNVCTAACP